MSERGCIRIVISGTVQGGGFRWRIRKTALSLGIAGWIATSFPGPFITM